MADFAVSTIFSGKDRGITSSFKRMTAGVNRFGKASDRAFTRASKGGSRFKDIVGGILTANVLSKGLGLVAQGFKSVVSEAARIQDAQAAFTPLLGSTEKAAKLVARLNEEAASTPFQFDNLSKAAGQLLPSMNGDIEQTVSTMRMLGDTAGGSAQKLESITRGFNKALLKGKPDLESLGMIADANVPIFQEMAKSMGISKEELFTLSKQGKLTNKDLTKTFKDMTKAGGIFHNGMAIASKTLSGRFSTFKDITANVAGTIGTALMPVFNDIIEAGIKIVSFVGVWVKENKELIKTTFSGMAKGLKIIAPLLPVIVAGFIAYNVALKVQLAMGAIMHMAKFARVMFALTKAKGVAAAAQWLLNAAMTANPVGAVIVGIAALIAIVVLLVVHWDYVKKKFFELTEIFDNPIFAALGAIFMPFITIPILIARNWDAVIAVIMRVVSVAKSAASVVSGALGVLGFGSSEAPNKKQADAKAQNVNVKGNINITGETKNVTSKSETKGVKLNTLGAQ